jgi:hypothetical protein
VHARVQALASVPAQARQRLVRALASVLVLAQARQQLVLVQVPAQLVLAQVLLLHLTLRRRQ